MGNYESVELKLKALQDQVKLMQHLYFTVNLRRKEKIPTIELLQEIKAENEVLMLNLRN